MKHFSTMKIVILCCVLIAMSRGSLLGMGFQEQKTPTFVGESNMSNAWKRVLQTMQQMRQTRYGIFYDTITSMPPEIINIILGYANEWLPSESIAHGQQLECVKKMRAHNTPIQCIAELQKGFATAAQRDEQIKVWDYKDNLVKALYTKMYQVKCLQQISQGDLVVAGCSKNALGNNIETAQIWDLKTYLCKQEIKDSEGELACMAVMHTKDNIEWLAFGSSDGSIIVRNLVSKVRQWFQNRESPICALAVLADRRLVAISQDGTIQLWNWANGELLDEVQYKKVVTGYLASFGGAMSFLVPMDDLTLVFGDTKDGAWGRIAIDEKKNLISSIAVESVEDCGIRAIAKCSNNRWVIVQADGEILPFVVDEKNKIKQLTTKNGEVFEMKFDVLTADALDVLTAAAVMRQAQDWVITGNRLGEISFWI